MQKNGSKTSIHTSICYSYSDQGYALEGCCKMTVDNWRSLEVARRWVLYFTSVDGLLHGRFANLEELSIC